MEVFVTVQRKNMTIFTSTKDTAPIMELKLIIEGIIGASPANQQLWYKEMELNAEKRFEEYGLNSITGMPHLPAMIGLALRQGDGRFEPLELSNYTSPPDLPYVMKAGESCNDDRDS